MKIVYFCLLLSYFGAFSWTKAQTIFLNEEGVGSIPVFATTQDTISPPSSFFESARAPIKTIRVVFHVLQKNDGSGNFPNDSASLAHFQKIIENCNHILSHLPSTVIEPYEGTIPRSSVYDSRFRWRLEKVLFHASAWDWNFSRHPSVFPKMDTLMKKYVTHFPEADLSVDLKEHALHFFLGLSVNPDRQQFVGQAQRVGGKGWFYSLDDYRDYIEPYTDKMRWTSQNLLHEGAHLFGLVHTFSAGEGCDDTPSNYCATNNIMDYACRYQNSFSPCQLETMHRNFDGNANHLFDVIVPTRQLKLYHNRRLKDKQEKKKKAKKSRDSKPQ